MKRLVIGMVIVSTAFICRAQDQLYRTDNSRITVKVVEITPDEVRYRPTDNASAPVQSEKRSNISLIIFENGRHEVMNQPVSASQITTTIVSTAPVIPVGAPRPLDPMMSKADSLSYYRHNQDISVNFLNFVNNEVGLLYTREYYSSSFNIMIPVAFGLSNPNVTEAVYYHRNNNYFDIAKKRFEVGFGINYLPSYRTNVNYFIGPMFRLIQFDGYNVYRSQVPSPPYSYTYTSISRPATLTSYCISITNGLVFRTRSRLNAKVFISLGFKSDNTDNKIVDPNTNETINAVQPISFMFWSGFNVGFAF